jgi:hypothetical protein
MTTFRTSLRGISRIYNLCPNAFLGKLIARLELQRRIRPSTDFLSKVFPLFQRCFSDIAKVFEYDYPSSDCIGILSQGLRGNMHEMFRNGSLFVCKADKESPRRTSAYGLNLSPTKSDRFSQVIKFSTMEEKRCSVRGVRGNKHPLDARIHSYNTTFFSWFRYFFLITKDQVQFISDFFKFRVLPILDRVLGMMQGNGFTPKGNTFSTAIEITFPNQGDSGILKDSQFPSFVGLSSFIGCGNMLAYTASKLTGKIKLTTKYWIIGLGKSIRIHLFGVENYRR